MADARESRTGRRGESFRTQIARSESFEHGRKHKPMGTYSAARASRATKDVATAKAIEPQPVLGPMPVNIPSHIAEQSQELLDLTREAISILDAEGRIVFWNRGAEHLYGWAREEVTGQRLNEVLKTDLPRPLAQIENILRHEGCWDCELRHTTKQGTRITVASRWALWQDETKRVRGRFQLDTDITRRKQIENELRVLSGRLLSLRDEERRRLARDLHDSVGQLLAGAAMNLAMAQRKLSPNDPASSQLLNELGNLLEQSVKEVRTMSYLLHPPLLDEVGLPSALEWYISGFSERSQIKVELNLPPELGRFARDVELAIFRIVQETLTNVHRHSGSQVARITVSKSAGQIRLKVEDEGKGMELPLNSRDNAERPLLGVGISGMRERVRNLGGQMQLRSGSWGTVVEVLLPTEETRMPAASAGQ
jgi:PAS domain S-box-containing protein